MDTATANVQRSVRRRRFGHSKFTDRYYKVLKGVAVELSDAALEYVRNQFSLPVNSPFFLA